MSKYDFMIVGAGFFGAAFARKILDAGKTCLIIDKNNHLAGAAYDRKWDNGIIVSEYGAHILHSQSDEIWNFLCKFSKINNFINKPKVISQNKVYSFPLNLMTFHQLWGCITPQECLEKLESVKIKCNNPKNFEEWILDKVGKEIYEKFFYGYTKKQYFKEPKELPSSIIQRLPIKLTYEENYFITKHQGIPEEGFTSMVKNMIDGASVDLGVDFFSIDNWKSYAKHLIYCGPIDKFYNYTFGELDYNTLRFEFKRFKGDYQGNAVFNHVDLETPYIRSIEHKHFYKKSFIKHENKIEDEETIVSFDYPIPFKDHKEPYYPIRDEKNSRLYDMYYALNKDENITFGGRLGEYKYLDIDQTVASALTKAERILKR